jgi:hypothetical protein
LMSIAEPRPDNDLFRSTTEKINQHKKFRRCFSLLRGKDCNPPWVIMWRQVRQKVSAN